MPDGFRGRPTPKFSKWFYIMMAAAIGVGYLLNYINIINFFVFLCLTIFITLFTGMAYIAAAERHIYIKNGKLKRWWRPAIPINQIKSILYYDLGHRPSVLALGKGLKFLEAGRSRSILIYVRLKNGEKKRIFTSLSDQSIEVTNNLINFLKAALNCPVEMKRLEIEDLDKT